MTYEETKREVLQGLLNGVIYELSFRDDIKMWEDREMTKRIDYKEAAAFLIDGIAGADDEDFEKFKNKLIELFYDML